MGEVIDKPCPYCKFECILVYGDSIYPHRPDLFHKPFWLCIKCKAWAGCHPGTTKRMGRVANVETRRLKMAAHAVFDPIWKSRKMSRKKAYKWLQEQTGLSERDCHIGWMEDSDLSRVITICEEFTNG